MRIRPAQWIEQHATTPLWKVRGSISNRRRWTGDHFVALIEAPSLEAALEKIAEHFPAGAQVHHAEAMPPHIVLLSSAPFASSCSPVRVQSNRTPKE